MRRPAAPLAPSDPAPDVDLDAMYAAELPPCEVKTWNRWQKKPPACGLPSVKIVTLHCSACGPRPKACCAKHLRVLRRRQRVADAFRTTLWRCGKCGGGMTVGGLS